MKKLYTLLAAGFSSAIVLADEGAASIPTTVINNTMNDISESLTGFVTDAMPFVASVGAAFMAFWLGRMVFGLIKTWANAGK